MGKPLDLDFYCRDTVQVAKELLGCLLINHTSKEDIGGIIVETEAYLGKEDPACHSAKSMTERNKTMFKGAGFSYVYLIYGIHYCYNVTTSADNKPEAVLIRALEPTTGIEFMKRKRKKEKLIDLCSGPGKLTQALDINLNNDGQRVDTGNIRIYSGKNYDNKEIAAAKRIGISTAKDLLLRFYIKDNKFISKK